MAKTKQPKPDDKYVIFFTDKHLYEVYDRDGVRVLFCDDNACVDSQERINELAASGHKFKVKGKLVPKTRVLEEISKKP